MTRVRRVVPILLLALAAQAILRSHDLAWGGADAPDGTRYKAGPTVLVHVLAPHQTVSPTETCGWTGGVEARCAMMEGASGARFALRLVPITLYLAIALCIVAAIFGVMNGASAQRLGRVLVAAAAIACVVAPALFAVSAPRALAALAGLEFGVGGTLGTLLLAVTSAVLSGLTVARSRAYAIALFPLAAFLSMFPPLGGIAFLSGGLLVGFAAGKMQPGEPGPTPSPTRT